MRKTSLVILLVIFCLITIVLSLIWLSYLINTGNLPQAWVEALQIIEGVVRVNAEP